MESFRKKSPEVPVVSSASHTGTRVSFYCMVEVRELHRISEKEYRSVIADKIPVAGISVEFHCETSDVPFSICSSSFAGYSGETYKTFSLFADF